MNCTGRPDHICLFLCAACLLCSTSCIDIVQSLSYKGGDYTLYYRLMLSDSAAAFAGVDMEEISGELEAMAHENEAFRSKGAQIRAVSTETESGMEITVRIPENTDDEELKTLAPKRIGNTLSIPILYQTTDEYIPDTTDEAYAMSRLLLSGAKYRILIEKNAVPAPVSAELTNGLEISRSLVYYDMGNIYCIEIPLEPLIHIRSSTNCEVLLSIRP